MKKQDCPAVNPELAALLMTCSQNLRDKTAMLVAADACAEKEERSLEFLLRALAKHNRRMLFLGSRAYGTPRPNSDFDWLILDTKLKVFDEIYRASDSLRGASGTFISYTMKFGPVGVFIVSKQWKLTAVKRATEELVAQRPVTRDTAIATIDTHINNRREQHVRAATNPDDDYDLSWGSS